MTNEEQIIIMLVNKQSYFKELVKPLIDAKNMLDVNKIFGDDIEKEFKERVFQLFADDITKNLAIPTEDVMMVLENLNLNEYLRY